MDSFTLQEVQMEMSLSKHSDLVIYDIGDQENYPGRGKDIVGRAVALRHSKKSDFILSIRRDLDRGDDATDQNRPSVLIPSAIGQQTIRAFGYLLSRNILLPGADGQPKSSDYNATFLIFVRVSETNAIAAIVRHGDLHGNSAAHELADILGRFDDLVHGESDKKDAALTGLDFVTGRIVLDKEYRK